MSRSYRLFFIAFAGLALASADHPDAKGQPEQPDAQQSIANSLGDIATMYHQETERTQSPDKKTEPCEPGDDRRYSDLCAQWKAADAAAYSAWWAWAGGVLGVLSLAGVFVALGLAFHSNWIARDTAKRQLRAYLGVDSCEIEQFDGGYIITVAVQNAGQTPAYDAGIMGESFGAEYPLVAEHSLPIVQDDHRTPVNPGHSILGVYRVWCDDREDTLRRVMAGELGIYVHGQCKYRDVFDDWHIVTFRHVFGGRPAKTGGLIMHACQGGNSAN